MIIFKIIGIGIGIIGIGMGFIGIGTILIRMI